MKNALTDGINNTFKYWVESLGLQFMFRGDYSGYFYMEDALNRDIQVHGGFIVDGYELAKDQKLLYKKLNEFEKQILDSPTISKEIKSRDEKIAELENKIKDMEKFKTYYEMQLNLNAAGKT